MQVRISASNVPLISRARDLITRRCHSELKRYATQLQWVEMTIRDENGPRGGVDKRCVICAKTLRGNVLVVTTRAAELWSAIYEALERLTRRLSRKIGRQRSLRAAFQRKHSQGLSEILGLSA